MAELITVLPERKTFDIEFEDVYDLLDYLQIFVKVQKDKTGRDYAYYSVTDIYREVKQYLKLIRGANLYFKPIEDTMVGDWHMKRATVVLRYKNKEGNVSEFEASSTCREAESKVMSAGQASGATESYVKKYALNTLLLIDDGTDLDGGGIQQYWEYTEEDYEPKKLAEIAKAMESLNPTPEQVAEWKEMSYQEAHKSIWDFYEAYKADKVL